jgi:hypothetical protein
MYYPSEARKIKENVMYGVVYQTINLLLSSLPRNTASEYCLAIEKPTLKNLEQVLGPDQLKVRGWVESSMKESILNHYLTLIV